MLLLGSCHKADSDSGLRRAPTFSISNSWPIYHLFEIPGKNCISLPCQMKQDFFRFPQLETGMVIAGCTRNQSNHDKLNVRFSRSELEFRWSNNYVNTLEHLPVDFLVEPGIFPQFSPLIKQHYKLHSNEFSTV